MNEKDVVRLLIEAYNNIEGSVHVKNKLGALINQVKIESLIKEAHSIETSLVEFYIRGYSIEYQVHLSGTNIGEYNLIEEEHYCDIQSSEESTFYYITGLEGDRLYNFEFQSTVELSNFIHFAMTNGLNLDEMNEDDVLSKLYVHIAKSVFG